MVSLLPIEAAIVATISSGRGKEHSEQYRLHAVRAKTIQLLIFRLRLNLGTVGGQDEGSTGCLCYFSGHTYKLALVGGDDFLYSSRRGSECYEVEYRAGFRLIKIEGYRLSTARDAVFRNLGVYYLAAYNHRFAEVVLGIGGGYARRGRTLRKYKRQQSSYTQRNDRSLHDCHFPVRDAA